MNHILDIAQDTKVQSARAIIAKMARAIRNYTNAHDHEDDQKIDALRNELEIARSNAVFWLTSDVPDFFQRQRRTKEFAMKLVHYISHGGKYSVPDVTGDCTIKPVPTCDAQDFAPQRYSVGMSYGDHPCPTMDEDAEGEYIRYEDHIAAMRKKEGTA